MRENRVDEPRMIDDSVARLGIAQGIDERNLIVRRTGQGAHDKFEISRRAARIDIHFLPGNYNAIVPGKNDTTGNALVEVYELP